MTNEQITKRLFELSEELAESASKAEELALDLTSQLEGERLLELQGTFDKIYSTFAMTKRITETNVQMSRIACQAILGEREAAVFFAMPEATKDCCNIDCFAYKHGTCRYHLEDKANCPSVKAKLQELLDEDKEYCICLNCVHFYDREEGSGTGKCDLAHGGICKAEGRCKYFKDYLAEEDLDEEDEL